MSNAARSRPCGTATWSTPPIAKMLRSQRSFPSWKQAAMPVKNARCSGSKIMAL
jgi:hypothetical protein